MAPKPIRAPWVYVVLRAAYGDTTKPPCTPRTPGYEKRGQEGCFPLLLAVQAQEIHISGKVRVLHDGSVDSFHG